MCRNIKTLFNFDPPATDEEIEAAALQFVRKLSGFHEPSVANKAAFDAAVKETAAVAKKLLTHLSTHAEPRNREVEAAPVPTSARSSASAQPPSIRTRTRTFL